MNVCKYLIETITIIKRTETIVTVLTRSHSLPLPAKKQPPWSDRLRPGIKLLPTRYFSFNTPTVSIRVYSVILVHHSPNTRNGFTGLSVRPKHNIQSPATKPTELIFIFIRLHVRPIANDPPCLFISKQTA